MQVDSPTLPQVLYKWRKAIIFFVLISTITATIVALILPKQYASTSIVVPANPKITDKNFAYSNNLLELTGNFGTEEDLDRLLTTLRLSTNFSKMVDSFNLIEHYNITNNKKAKANAIGTLVKNSSIIKTDNGAIAVSVYDKDANYAANIANAIVKHTEYQTNLQNQLANISYYESLEQTIAKQKIKLNSTDTINNATIKATEQKVQLNTLEKNLTSAAELQLAIQANPASIHILEKAYPSQKAAKPKVLFWVIAGFICSLLFSCIAVVLYEFISTHKK